MHGSIAAANYTLKTMGETTGAFKADFSDLYTDLSSENLQKYDLLLFNSTTRLKMPAENRTAILAFIKSGKGIAGIHAASDNFSDWKEGAELMGGVFNGHPWTSKGEWAYKNDVNLTIHNLMMTAKMYVIFHFTSPEMNHVYTHNKKVGSKITIGCKN